MVFLSKHIRYAIPPDLADHMAKVWSLETPFEPNVMVIEVGPVFNDRVRVRKLEGSGNWFSGNVGQKV